MKLREESSSTIISTIKYILDELLLDLSPPLKTDIVFNGTRQMLYNSSTKWNTEYSRDIPNVSSVDEINANDFGILLMSEFVVDDDELPDFKFTNHSLTKISQQHDVNNNSDWTSDDEEVIIQIV
jgi:hypothetical protein